MHEHMWAQICERLVIEYIFWRGRHQLLYSLDSKTGGLLSKRGFRRKTSPLEMHYKQGAYFWGGLTFGRGLAIHTLQYLFVHTPGYSPSGLSVYDDACKMWTSDRPSMKSGGVPPANSINVGAKSMFITISWNNNRKSETWWPTGPHIWHIYYCGVPGSPCLSKTGLLLARIFLFLVVCQYVYTITLR